jgi:hypothetical protein
MVFTERLPLEFVIKDAKLMKSLWDELGLMQQVIVKILYGLPLETIAERRAWAILNDNCKIDVLGFVTEWWETPYEAMEYNELVALIGRRSGKSYLTCFIALYEIIFGGHSKYVKPKQEFIIPYIAQDLPTARVNMRMIEILANQVPMLAAQIVDSKPNFIKFRNGLTVQIEPPRVKTGRGWAMPMLILDEVGFWPTAEDAADPDVEVLRAVRPSTLQFPHKKILIISSPYTETGLLWKYAKAGTLGKNLASTDDSIAQYTKTCVLRSSTAAMENPVIQDLRTMLAIEQAADPEGFVREYNARFIKSASAFILGEHVDQCTSRGVFERTLSQVMDSGDRPAPVAVMDPAFKNDDFAFAIFHNDRNGKVVMDMLKVWTPQKKLGISLDPDEILTEIAGYLKKWEISLVYSDQYQLEALQQIAQRKGFSIIKVDFTAKSKARMYGSLNNLLKTKSIDLLDYSTIYQQLTRLVKKQTAMNTVHIGAPVGEKDDVATVVAIGADIAIQLRPTKIVGPKKEMTLFEQGLECIRRKRVAAITEDSWQ